MSMLSATRQRSSTKSWRALAEKRSIVADSGPLIGLARIGSLDLLQSVFSAILIPTAVASECCRDMGLPGAQTIRAAIEDRELRVVELLKTLDIEFPPSLGEGERAVLELSITRGIGALMDDRPGRRLAKQEGVPILGTGGLLLLAKRRGAIERIEPLLSGLLDQGYRLSRAVVEDLLQRAGETPSD